MENNMDRYKLILFDMDGTLIADRGIFVIAEKMGFIDDLWRLIKDDSIEFYQRSIEIAKLSKDYNCNDFLDIFRAIPFQKNLENVISKLKEKKFIIAVATDSYQFFADDVKNRLGFDYAFANKLIIKDDIITGDLVINNNDLKKDFITNNVYSICKSAVLENLCNKYKIPLDEAIAVGDGRVDKGMIAKAGLGIAFNAHKDVNDVADVVTNDMKDLLEYI